MVINMEDDEPDALASLLKYLYTLDSNHIKIGHVTHTELPDDYFHHLVQVWILADKHDVPLLRAELCTIVSGSDEEDGLSCCAECWTEDESKDDACITFHRYAMQGLEALGVAKEAFPPTGSPWHGT